MLAFGGFTLARSVPLTPEFFEQSPPPAIPSLDTLIGPKGLDNIRECYEDVLADDVPGDLIEAGAWRGGAAIFMGALLEAYSDPARTVWVADSFRGFPSAEESGYAEDVADLAWSDMEYLSVPLEAVQRTFERYHLLGDRVRFLVGWFSDTLPSAPIEELSLIRIDADMYGSTMDALRALYPRLSTGGYVIIDDYWLPNCRAAVDEFREQHQINDELVAVDRAIVNWRRTT